MRLALAILERDLCSWPRRKWFYLKRTGFAAIGCLMILWGFMMGAMTQTSTIGLQIFQSLSTTVLFAVGVLSAVVAGLTIVREKVERTLGVLFLTDISCWRQVIGKFLTSTSLMVMAALSVFPMFVLSASLGGVSPGQISAAFGILLGMIFLGCGVGIFAATFTRTEKALVSAALLMMVAVLVLIPLAAAYVNSKWLKLPERELLCVISSFVAMQNLGRGVMLGAGLWNALFNVLLGLPFLVAAARLLPRGVVAGAESALLRTIKERLRATRLAGKWVSRPRVSHNPVTWRDRHFTYGGPRREALLCLLLQAGIAAAAVIIGVATDAEADGTVIGALVACAIISALVFGVSFVVRAARAFNTEKQGRTLEVLLTTPLSDNEIVWGKIAAIALACLPWLVAALITAALAMATGFIVSGIGDTGMDELIPIVIFGAFVVSQLADVFLFASLALLLSLRLRTPAVLGICFLAAFVWNSFVKMLLMLPMSLFAGALGAALTDMAEPLGVLLMPTIMFGPSVLVDLGLTTVFLHLVARNLRGAAIKEM